MQITTALLMTVVCRKRRVVERHEIKAASVDAQAAFSPHLKSHSNSLPLPPQLNLDHNQAPVSGPFKLVPRTSELAQCPVCYDKLVLGTAKRQSRGHVTTTGNDVIDNDVSATRPQRAVLTAASRRRGRCLFTNSVRRINTFNFISSV